MLKQKQPKKENVSQKPTQNVALANQQRPRYAAHDRRKNALPMVPSVTSPLHGVSKPKFS